MTGRSLRTAPLLLALAAVFIFPSHAAQGRKRSVPASAKPQVRAPVPKLGDDGMIEELKVRIETRMAASGPHIRELSAHSQRYASTPDLSGLDEQRDRLRKAVTDDRDDINELLDEFKALRKEFQYKRGVMIIAQFMTGEEPRKVDQDLKVVLDMGDYPDRVKRVISDANRALNTDEAEYRKILDYRKALQRKRRLILFGGLGAGIASASLIFLYKSRKRRLARTLTAVPVKSAGPPLPPRTRDGRPITVTGATPLPALLASRTPMPADALPDMIAGRFKVLREREKSPLGSVLEAQDTGDGRKVLVKRIREELHRTEKDLERFLARCRFVAEMKHPNLAEVYSVFLENERIHLVIEDPDGVPLGKFLDSGSRISINSSRRLLKQVCGLLDFAHAKKVIHGDLMPSNVFVNQQGAAKVMDFGIGIEARKVAAKLNWTEAIGSPAYMAPEQELGSVFPASDVYSLAVILYEMLTSRLPFEGPNFLAQKREMRFHPASRYGTDIPKGLDAVFAKALRPEPQMRYRTAMEFYASVEAAVVPPGQSRCAPNA